MSMISIIRSNLGQDNIFIIITNLALEVLCQSVSRKWVKFKKTDPSPNFHTLRGRVLTQNGTTTEALPLPQTKNNHPNQFTNVHVTA